jgi:hypothetical protein
LSAYLNGSLFLYNEFFDFSIDVAVLGLSGK